MRNLRRPPGKRELRAQIDKTAGWLDAMIPGGLPPDLQAAKDKVMPDAPRERKPRQDTGETLHRPLEADVIRAVEGLLAVHTRVLWALRMNSGAASYEAASGKFAPVWFHRWVRAPEKCRMSDFLGATLETPFGASPGMSADYRPRILAVECKRPGWSKPTDQREREQAAFLEIVRRNGGIGIFATSAAEVAEALG